MTVSYTTLQADIAEYLKRTDLTNQIKDFIELAEARIATELKPHGFEQVASGNLVASSRTLAQPSRFIAPISLTLTASGGDILKRRKLSFLRHYASNSSTAEARPEYYATRESDFWLHPIPDSTYAYTLTYFERLAPLTTSTNETNWITENHPDLLLYATLLAASTYLKNDDRVPVWRQAYQDAAQAVMAEEDRYQIDEAGM